jgi:fucose permease
MSFAPTFSSKFWIMCIAFFINGMGMSLLNAQCNSLLSMLRNPSAMGFAHASYGTGALIAPLISTQFAKLANGSADGAVNPKWAFYYLFMVVIALSDMSSFIFVFKGKGYEEVLSGMGVHSNEEEQALQLEVRQPVRPQNSEEDDNSEAEEIQRREQIAKKEKGSFVEVLKQVQVHLLAAFIFIYVGVEVTIGGTFE